MSAVDLDGMTLRANGKDYRIPFKPQLNSYRETRERVVEMDRESIRNLNKSDITVKEFIPPTISALYAMEFLIVASTFLSYSQRWWFARGSIVERVLGPGFARFSWIIQPWLISFMLALHSAEAVYFARNQLWKHSINIRSPTFWMWVGTVFVEGQFAFKRFHDHVDKTRQEKEKRKH
jgi:hypothetical protein